LYRLAVTFAAPEKGSTWAVARVPRERTMVVMVEKSMMDDESVDATGVMVM